MSCRLQFTGILVDPENYNTIPVLISNEAKLSCRVDIKIPRRFDVLSLVLHKSQCPLRHIDLVHHDAVVPTVGTVQKLSIWVCSHLSAGIESIETVRKRRDGLTLRQGARKRIVGKSSHRAIEFVNHISELAARME